MPLEISLRGTQATNAYLVTPLTRSSGKTPLDFFVPEDLEKDLSRWELETATVSGESEDDRWQVRMDGGRIWTSGTLTALRDDRGTRLRQVFINLIQNASKY